MQRGPVESYCEQQTGRCQLSDEVSGWWIGVVADDQSQLNKGGPGIDYLNKTGPVHRALAPPNVSILTIK